MNWPNLKVKRLARVKIAQRKVANIYRRLWEGGRASLYCVTFRSDIFVSYFTNRKAFFSMVSTDFL